MGKIHSAAAAEESGYLYGTRSRVVYKSRRLDEIVRRVYSRRVCAAPVIEMIEIS